MALLLLCCALVAGALGVPLFLEDGCVGANEVGVQGSPAPSSCAIASSSLDILSRSLNLTLRFGPAFRETVTAVHLHYGAGAGANSAQRFVLPGRDTRDLVLNASAVGAILAGTAYINVHTMERPQGALRGQLSVTPRVTEVFVFDGCRGANEVGVQGSPPPAWCSVRLFLDPGARTLSGSLEWSVEQGDVVTAAHIHLNAGPGANSPTRYLLFSSPRPSTSYAFENFALNASAVADLLTGNAYLNLHSQNRSGGALRGQLVTHHPRDYRYLDFSNGCVGDNERGTLGAAPPAACTLRGGMFDVRSNKLAYDTIITTLDAGDAVTDVHVHCGADASSSSSVRHVLPPRTNPIFDFQLNASCGAELRAGRAYLNLHTNDFPSGALRGQFRVASGVSSGGGGGDGGGNPGAVAAAIIFALLFLGVVVVLFFYWKHNLSKPDLPSNYLPLTT